MADHIIKPIEKPLSEDKHHGYSLMLYIGYTLSTDTTDTDPVVITAYAIKQQ